MVTGGTSIFFPPGKSHICISSCPREQAGVSLMENVAHDYSDGDWIMDN